MSILKSLIQQGRDLRLQSLNSYRQKFGLEKYKDFMDLTGDTSLAKELEKIYGHIDAVEWAPGTHYGKNYSGVVSAGCINGVCEIWYFRFIFF